MDKLVLDDVYEVIASKKVLSGSSLTLMVTDEEMHVLFVNDEAVPDCPCQCPGDFLHCLNAVMGDGCGTHRFCKSCRLRSSISHALESGERTQADVSMLLEGNTAYDARIEIVPFSKHGRKYALIIFNDQSSKRRELIMERMFFHDILNLSGALQGFLESAEGEDALEMIDTARELSRQLVEEINVQRDLIYAQKGILKVCRTEFPASRILEYAFDTLSPLAESHGMRLVLDNSIQDVEISSDFRLIHRVLLNMVKNAAESGKKGSDIILRGRKADGAIVLSVHNEGTVDESIRPDIFKFGNTSKGGSHGIGTYSMKLIGENFLRGKVWFTSDQASGTEFFLSLPVA